MTYRTDNKIRKYVKGYGFMSFAKNLKSKYGKKIMNKGISAASKFNQGKYGNMFKKHGSEFGKIAGKKILTKSADATGDLIGSKIADKITLLKVKDKSESERFPQETAEEQEDTNIPPEKKQQILNYLRLF